MIAGDSWLDEGVSNGLHTFTAIRDYAENDANAPGWVTDLKDKPLIGVQGPVGDRRNVRFFDLGSDDDGGWSSGCRGWIEFDESSVPKNSAILRGSFDFLWTPEGMPYWDAPPTFNPEVPNDLVLRLFYVSSVQDESKLDALAARGLLPQDWRSSRVA